MGTRAVALGLVFLAGGGPAAAQTVPADTAVRAAPTPPLPRRSADSATHVRGDWLVGVSFGVPGYGTEAVGELFTIGFNWTQLQPGRLGADFSLGTMPRTLADGVAVLGVRAGLALPLPLSSGILLLPSAGTSLIGGASSGGGGGTVGFNAGVAAVVFGESPTGLRAGITWHRFRDASGAVWLIELGMIR